MHNKRSNKNNNCLSSVFLFLCIFFFSLFIVYRIGLHAGRAYRKLHEQDGQTWYDLPPSVRTGTGSLSSNKSVTSSNHALHAVFVRPDV